MDQLPALNVFNLSSRMMGKSDQSTLPQGPTIGMRNGLQSSAVG